MAGSYISPEVGLLAIALVTAIWHAAMYVGRLTVKVQRHEDRLDDHDEEFREIKSIMRPRV